MPEENIAATQQAIYRLKTALFNQGRYAQNMQYQNNVTLAENDPFVTKLVELLKQKELTEQEYASIRKTQNWATYIKNTALSSPEYEQYKKKTQSIQTAINNLEQEYINFTKQEDAKNIVTQLKLPDSINTTLITQQITHMEGMIARYLSLGENKYYFNIPINNIQEPDGQEAHNTELELITKYKEFLHKQITQDINNIFTKTLFTLSADTKQQNNFNALINKFNNNEQIKTLLETYANLYAKKIFCEINQQLYSNFNINFFNEELDKAKAEQMLFLTKINLLIQQIIQDKYIIKHDTENTQHIEQIMQDIEKLTPQKIWELKKTATEKFYKIKNYQFLSQEQQEQFINNFIFIEYKIFLNTQQGTEKALIEQKIKTLIKETEEQIASEIEVASRSPRSATINSQQDLIKKITGWSTEPVVKPINLTSNQDTTYPLYDEANQIYNKISGINRLSPEQNIIFTKQIALTLGRLQQQNENQNWAKWFANKTWNSITSMIYSSPDIPESIRDNIKEIQTAIHNTFEQTQKIKDKIKKFQQDIYKTTEIEDGKLRNHLEKELADALINFKKNKFNISPLPSFTEEESQKDPTVALKTRLENTANRIETAKILTKIDSFNNIPLEQQLKYIDELNKNLLEISTLNNKIKQLKQELSTRTAAQSEIIQHNKNIEEKQQAIKKMIIDINLYSKDFTNIKTDFSITEDNTDLFNMITNLLATETVQNVASGIAIGAMGAMAAPALGVFANNIPFIGSWIAPLTANFSLSNIIAGGLIGGLIGIKVPLRKIFKPFTYLVEEISDIVKNPNNNSWKNRAVRSAAIGLSCAGVVAATAALVATVANPFSGPLVAGIVVGTVALGAAFTLSSVCLWATNKVLNTIKKSELYDATKAHDFCNGDKNKAKELSQFFEKHIKEYEDKLTTFTANSISNDLEKVHIQKILSMLQQTWKNITENKDPEWDTLLKVLYYDKKYGYQKDLEDQIKIADNVTTKLIELFDAPKCVKSREVDNQFLDNIRQKQQAAISFKDTITTKVNAFMATSNQELQNLYTISKIIKNRNNT